MSRNNIKAWNTYKTLYVIPYDEFFTYLNEDRSLFVYKDLCLKVDKPRIKTHLFKSNKCVCGISTTHFAIQLSKNQTTPHINAWHIVDDKTKYLMTSDHIISKRLNGSDDLSNRQVLCMTCNNKKN